MARGRQTEQALLPVVGAGRADPGAVARRVAAHQCITEQNSARGIGYEQNIQPQLRGTRRSISAGCWLLAAEGAAAGHPGGAVRGSALADRRERDRARSIAERKRNGRDPQAARPSATGGKSIPPAAEPDRPGAVSDLLVCGEARCLVLPAA